MESKKVLLETLPVLFLCALGGALSGFILGGMVDVLRMIPGLIALIPAIIDMRGNICSTMGARMGSAYHLGIVERGLTSKVTMENLKSSWALSMFVGAILPLLFWVTSFFLDFNVSMKAFITLTIISILTGISSGFILSLGTYLIVMTAIKFKVDPDNISGPMLTTVGDVLTLLVLFFFAYLIGGLII